MQRISTKSVARTLISTSSRPRCKNLLEICILINQALSLRLTWINSFHTRRYKLSRITMVLLKARKTCMQVWQTPMDSSFIAQMSKLVIVHLTIFTGCKQARYAEVLTLFANSIQKLSHFQTQNQTITLAMLLVQRRKIICFFETQLKTSFRQTARQGGLVLRQLL